MDGPAVAVAYSGGRDSTALLHATLAAARGSGVGVVALHVHHGLSVHADAWLAHCEACCARWAAEGHALAFASRRLVGRPRPGESVEAWAREARYAALAAMARAHGVDLVLLGHHRRDQAETVLLQALRGAGPAGLAAMPRSALRGGVTWARPWLDVAPGRIASYALAHALDWVEDDSNADTRHARNRLRHAVWPALVAAFPDAEGALAGVAAHAAEALACGDELAAIDLPALDAGAGGLRIDAWARLAPARRGNALRAWVRQAGGGPAPASLVARLLDELVAGDAPASWPAPRGRMLRRYRGVLRCVPGAPAAPAAVGLQAGAGGDRAASAADDAAVADDAAAAAGRIVSACADRPATACGALPAAGARFEGALGALLAGTGAADAGAAGAVRLPGWGGTLRWTLVAAGGLAAGAIGCLRIAPRGGGERFQAAAGRPPRSLKKQFQALGMPAWRRDAPLAWLGDAPAFVPGLGIDARALAPQGVPQFALAWQPDAPDDASGGAGTARLPAAPRRRRRRG